MRCLALLLITTFLPSPSVSQTPKVNPRDARITATIPYGNPPGQPASAPALTMDYYAPAGPGPHPAVIIVHGGGFTGGTSRNGSEAYCADFLTPAGYAVFSINYRLAPGATFADMIDDVQRSIRFVRSQAATYSLDPSKIVLLGGSAGGYLSNMVGLLPPTKSSSTSPHDRESGKLAAVVTLYGISDIPSMPDPSFVEKNHLLGAATPSPAELAAASPLAHVHPGAPPFLFIHGDHDESVPFQQSTRLQAALRAARDRADLITIPGGIHGTWTWHTIPAVPDWERQLTEWLNHTLDHQGPIGPGIEARTPHPAS